MAYHRTSGIILRCTDFSESSQVVALITPDAGQVHALAKGARRPRKDGRLPLDLLNLCDVVLALKPSKGLHILAEYSLRDHFRRLRGNIESLWSAFYAGEIVLRSTSENPDDGAIFPILLDFLVRLEGGEQAGESLCRFLVRTLTALGNAPILDHCARCGSPLGAATRFSPAAGGALCEDCGAQDPYAFPISRGALAVAKRLESDAERSPTLKIAQSQAVEIRRAFAAQLQYHLGQALRTERFLAGLNEQPHAGTRK